MSKPLSFQCHMRNTIKDVFLSRGYTEIPCPEEEDEDDNMEWDFIWASRAWIHTKMLGNAPIVLRPTQRVNHFPNSFELTRKDLMAKNLQRLKRELRKTGQDATLDFYPVTYVYPVQYASFLDDMRRKEGPWICKPVAGSMGQGIVFVTSEQEAASFNSKTQSKMAQCETPEDRQRLYYVMQRYIPNPLLIGGRKFDIRLYALTLSFNPMIVYVYRGGFCRFSSQPFSMSFNNREVHLTNIAVQTHSDQYNARHGCKWDTYSLRQYISNRYGYEESNQVFTAIQGIILNSLLSVSSSTINDRHCYELYGYDILIADDLRPWLIEINASPSLDANTEDDYDLKFSFLNEMLDLVQLFMDKGSDKPLPLHYGGYDLAWNGGPVFSKVSSTVTSYIGCQCPIIQSPNNPYRTKSKFRVKKAKVQQKEETKAEAK